MGVLRVRAFAASALAALVFGCGGGGGSDPAAPNVVDVGLLPCTVTSRVVVPVVNPLPEAASITEATLGLGVRVDPAVLPLAAAAGQTVDLPLLIAPNSGTPTLHVALRFAGSTRTVDHDLTVRATFDAVTWTLTPTSFEFGALPPGGTLELAVRLVNRSAVSPVTITAVTLPATHFTLVSPSLPVTVDANHSVNVLVRYDAGVGGWHDGTCLVGPGDVGARLTLPIHAGEPEQDGEEVIDLGPAVFTTGESAAMPFTVPDDAISVSVEIRGGAGDDFEVAALLGPGGASYAPRTYVSVAGLGYGLALLSYTVPDTDVPAGQLPPTGGEWSVRFRLLQGTGDDAHARVLLERRPGALAPTGRLDLNVWLGPGLGVTAATAPGDATLTATFARVAAELATRGIQLGNLTYYDVADSAFLFVALDELDELFALSGTAAKTRLNVFVVQQMELVAGYAGRIGGPRLNGTRGSGVAVSRYFAATGDELGLIAAHEIGHYLGLFHVVEQDGFSTPDLISDTSDGVPNLMAGFLGSGLTAGQGHVMRRHPHLRPVPPGAAKPGIAPATYPLPPGLLPAPECWCGNCMHAATAAR